MELYLVFLIIVSGLGILEAQTNYCNPALCPNGKRHIACNNNGAFSSNCASNPRIMRMTSTIRNNILKRHNVLRGRVARGGFNGFPGAVRMATMQWNNELARLAVFNVKRCIAQHDGCRSTSVFPYAGQNLARTSYFGLNISVNTLAMQHVQLWFDEYRYTTRAALQSYRDPPQGRDIGHFTQMMQQKASRVGCAILRQERGSTTDQFMACNYAFTNVLNQPVYDSGRAASGCRTGRNGILKSLCSRNERYNFKVKT